MRVRRRPQDRTGLAAVEFAVVLPLLFLLMLGTWELGRIIQVIQVMANAAREGARIAAQGQTVNSTGTYTQIMTATGTPNVKTTVQNYLIGAGITNVTGLVVQFQFLDGNTGNSDPWQATKNQRYKVRVTLPYNNVRITNLDLLNITTLESSVQWVSMADDPFTVDATLPTWSPLP